MKPPQLPSSEVVKECQVVPPPQDRVRLQNGIILSKKEKRVAIFCVTVTSLFWVMFGASFMVSYIISKNYEQRYVAMSLCFGDKNCALKLVKGMDGKVKQKRARGGP